jgi:hypothetical protein
MDEDTGRLRATLFFSPRLRRDADGGGLLSEYPLLSDWAAVVAGMKFVLEFDGVVKVDASPDPASTPPDPGIWHTVFGPDVGVVDHEPKDLSEQQVNSFPANEVANDLLGVYAQVGASSPFVLPPVTSGPLADFAGEIGWIAGSPEDSHGRLAGGFREEQSSVVEGRRGRYLPRGVRQAMGRFGLYATTQRFYDRYLDGERLRNPETAGVKEQPRPETPPIDFHGYVAALGDYPQLLRQLGLAVDVVLDDPGLPVHGKVRVLFPDPPADWFQAPQVAPWTHYEYELPWFLPQPRDDRRLFSHGQLNFHTERLWVHQIDIDGSVLKALNAATSLVTQRSQVTSTDGPSMTADEGSLPALRGAGFTVVRDERAESVVGQFDQMVKSEQQVAGSNPAELFAEDVTRGYFIDVDKDGRGFASLCQRVGRYAIRQPDGSETELPVPPDEGYAKGASTTAVPGDKELYLHEAMFSWSGWSMVAGRPGRRLTPEESLEEPDEPLEVDPVVPLVTSFTPAPGSLTPLRYGATYRLRARLADLAGNSVRGKALEEADQEPSTKQVYRRWEPVPAPAVVPQRGYAEGESQLRMVIRSTLDVTPADYVQLPRVAGLTAHQGDAAYRVQNHRWIVPPKTSQQMAELHGVFDEAFGGATPAAIAEQDAIARRESGVLQDLVPDDTLTLPYLPDVSSRAAAFAVLPGQAPGQTFVQRWPVDDTATAAWWDRQPFRIEIVDGPDAAPVTPVGGPLVPEWVDGERVLRVAVPQAEVVRVRVSSGIDPDDLEIQGGWSLVKNLLPPLAQGQALLGRMWLVTPSLELVLVHAVEKPLLPPVVAVPQSGMARNSGETFCGLTGVIDNHAKSTGRLDVEAVWQEQVDDLQADAPLDGVDGRGLLDGHAHVGDFDLEATEDDCRVGRTSVTGNGLPTRHELRHQFGDTRHRLVSYRARATTRFREYFDPEIADTIGADGVPLMEHHGPEVALHAPSSRRPDPPEVAYVIPTFSWTETSELERVFKAGPQQVLPRPRTITIRTRACGLRVYLRRPWFSSGDGELLGVVLRKQPWLSFGIDERIGMEVSEGVRLEAERTAQLLIDRGLVVAKGAATQPATSRLLRGLGVKAADAGVLSLAEVSAPMVEKLAGIGAELGALFPHVEVPAPDHVLTAWGADPAYLSVGPSGGPFIHQFGLRVAVAPEVVPVEEPWAKVTVVGHQPKYDPDRRLWYCDIDLPAGSAYTPFVRLALCRYQRWSIPGHEISKVVRADFAQVLPRRELRVRNGTPKRVTLRGPVGSPSASSLGLRRVQARVESRPAGGTDLDWRPLGEPVVLDGTLGDSGLAEATWTGNITPLAAPEGHERRLLVEEFESFLSDEDPDDPLDATRRVQLGVFQATFRERLVYADSVPL